MCLSQIERDIFRYDDRDRERKRRGCLREVMRVSRRFVVKYLVVFRGEVIVVWWK